MQNITVYCQISCLLKISDKIENLHDFENNKKYDLWANLYELLANKSRLIVDSSYEELVAIKNEYIRALVKRERIKSYNQNSFDDMMSDNSFFDNISPHSLFFLDKTADECRKLEEDFGFIFISKDELETKAKYLFESSLQSSYSSSFNSWSFLKKHRHPCNSVVVIDNYLLTDMGMYFEKNIIRILDEMLPVKINKQSLDITIITQKNVNNILVEKFYSRIKEVLELKYSKLNLCVLLSNSFHDRCIITNYGWLSSGHGFNILDTNNKTRKKTNIAWFPYTYLQKSYKNNIDGTTDLMESYLPVIDIIDNILKECKDVAKRAENSSKTATTIEITNFFGTKKNKLI